jgi:toxin secretion/phage lysis holin
MKMQLFNGAVAVIGTVATYAFGGWSQLFAVFLLTIAIDYVTGIAASLKEKKGLNSEVGFWGLAKKGLMLLIIMLAHRMDIAFEIDILMTGAIYFYLANELISITENYGRLGLPMPDSIRKLIEILKNKKQSP